MAEKIKKIIKVNKVAKIKTVDLPIPQRINQPEFHYVFVRDYDVMEQMYNVNICTHLDSYNRATRSYEYNYPQLRQVKKGNTYPIPLKKSSFPNWTGIKKKNHKIPKGKMYDFNCHKIKDKHDENFIKFFK